jgi:leucyl-tRNA synthetase
VKFLARAWRACGDAASATGTTSDAAFDKVVAHAVHEVATLTEAFRFNVAIARLMSLTSALRKAVDRGVSAEQVRGAAETLAILLSLFAPYTAEDCWARLGHDVEAGDSVQLASWPAVDEALLVEDTTTCVVQVAGKVRDKLEVPVGIAEDALREQALASAAVQRALDGRPVAKVIVRAPKLVNIVPG